MYGKDIYGSFIYAENKEKDINKTDCYIDLMHYLPKYWHSIAEMIALQYSLGKEIGILNCTEKEFFRQCFIDTATWGLALWEQELGLETNTNKPLEFRREIIKAKLRGTATSTVRLIENVASAFANGEVQAIEHNSKYAVEIKFIGVKGIPPNMQALKKALREIIPAHLGIYYTYTYTVWGDIKNYNWEEINAHTWGEVKVLQNNTGGES